MTSLIVLVATRVYSAVVSSLAWPSRAWITRTSMFCSSRCVAKLRRNVCSETRLLISAICAAAWQARLSWRVVIGCTRSRPGNSQPGVAPPSTRSAAARADGARASRSDPCGPPPSRGQALALLDTDDHPFAVDVADLERDYLGSAQARSIGHTERRLVLEPRRGIEQPRHFLWAQHHRQFAGLMDEVRVLQDIVSLERDPEEEPQRRDALVEGRNAGAMRRRNGLIASSVMGMLLS